MQMAIAETHNYDKTYIKEIYFACKGACDESLEHKYMSSGFITSWKDISDIMIPTEYLNWIMGVLNRIRSTEYVYSDIAFETLKQFILRVSQYVVRENTSAAAARLRVLADTYNILIYKAFSLHTDICTKYNFCEKVNCPV